MKKLFADYKILFICLGMIIVSSLISSTFLTEENLLNILKQVTVNGILACGMTFVMLTGGFDLSVGSVLSVGAVFGVGLQFQVGTGGAIVGALLIGAVAGTVTGAILSKINANSGEAFMITLGFQLIYAGIALIYTNGGRMMLPHGGAPFYTALGQGKIFGFLPVPVLIFIIVALVSHAVLAYTTFGRRIYLTGGSYEAARLSGIRVRFYKMIVYAIAGFTAAIAGIILSARVNGGLPEAGKGYELYAIAAVMVGGIAGGDGNILKTLLGVLTIGILGNILNLMGVSPFNQRILMGIIIVAAVWLQRRKT